MKNFLLVLLSLVFVQISWADEKGEPYKRLEALFNQAKLVNKDQFSGLNDPILARSNCVLANLDTSSNNLTPTNRVPVHLLGVDNGPLYPDRSEAILFLSNSQKYDDTPESLEREIRAYGRLETSPDLVQYWSQDSVKYTYRAIQNLIVFQQIRNPESNSAQVSYGYCWQH